MKTLLQYRQGDILLEQVEPPATSGKLKRTPRTKRGIVLAEGEATGHAHVIRDESAAICHFGGSLLLEVTAPSELAHEEHGTITVEPGFYRVIRQREYDPEARKRVRRIAD